MMHLWKNIAMLAFGLLISLLVACGKGGEKAETNTGIGSTGNPEIDNISAMLAKDPNNASLLAARASLLHENEAYEAALSDIAKALARDSNNLQYLHLLANIYMDGVGVLSMPESPSFKALKTMEHAAALYPDSIYTLLKLSEVQLQLQQNKESLTTIDKILKKQPTNQEAYFMMGMNLKEMGDTTRAIKSFEKCVLYDARHIDGYNELGVLYTDRNDPKALQYFTRALQVDSTSAQTWYNMAIFHQNRREDAKAKDIYRRIISIDREFELAYFNMGVLLLEADSLQPALNNFDLALTHEPYFAEGHYLRGVTLERIGDKEEALKSYQQAVSQKPNYEPARLAKEKLEIALKK